MRSFPVDTRSQPDPLVAKAIGPIACVLQQRVSYALPLMAGSHHQGLHLGIPLACQQADALDLAKANKYSAHLGNKSLLVWPFAQRS